MLKARIADNCVPALHTMYFRHLPIVLLGTAGCLLKDEVANLSKVVALTVFVKGSPQHNTTTC